MGLKTRPPAGTKVRLTGMFLKNTGQQTGPEGAGRWIVQACGCRGCSEGTLVATDEPHPAALDRRGYEDVPDEIRLAMKRHIAIGNLEIVGAKPKAEDYPGGAHDPPIGIGEARGARRRR